MAMRYCVIFARSKRSILHQGYSAENFYRTLIRRRQLTKTYFAYIHFPSRFSDRHPGTITESLLWKKLRSLLERRSLTTTSSEPSSERQSRLAPTTKYAFA